MQLIDHLNFRYATKKYDTSKIVSNEDLNKIKEAVRLAASSYGLQPYKVLEVNDSQTRAQLKNMSWGQSPVTDASHFLVFCNHTQVDDNFIDDFVKFKAIITNKEEEKYNAYAAFVKSKIKSKSSEEVFHWTAKQAYIALGNAMLACAELGIDCTPMEGFEANDYNSLLNLNEKGLNACVALAIGYRSEEDQSQFAPKVRRPLEDLVMKI